MTNYGNSSYENELNTKEIIDVGKVTYYFGDRWVYGNLSITGRAVDFSSPHSHSNLELYLGGYIQFGLDMSENDLQIYNYGDTKLRSLNEEQIAILSTHVKDINHEAKQLVNNYNKKYLSMVKESKNQDILFPFFDGFIDHFLPDKNQTIEVFSEIESFIVLMTEELEWFLQVDSIERAKCISKLTDSMREFVDNGGDFEEFNSVERTVGKAFSQLEELVRSKTELEYTFSIYFTYKLLWDRILFNRARRWEHEYHNYFLETNEDLNSYIVQFKTIHEIDHRNPKSIGSFVCYLIWRGILSNEEPFFDNISKVEKMILKDKNISNMEFFEEFLLQPIEKTAITVEEIDIMTGYEFEGFVGKLFSEMGFSTTVTKSSGDQGIDIIAKKNNVSFGIQAKKYTGSVGNSSVQETVAGLNHYGLKKGIVLTTSHFTKSAIQLAESNDILLWDRDKLIELIETYLN